MIAVCSLGQTIADRVIVARILDKYVGRRREPRWRVQRAGTDRNPPTRNGLPEQARSANLTESSSGGRRRPIPAQTVRLDQDQVFRPRRREGPEMATGTAT